MGKQTTTQYETVEDTKDLRIPVQSEEAFEHGIAFKCKYVGTEEIPRPNSRLEIVAAMRRIRYEHKYRNIKKRKVFIDISADGIKVNIRKKQKKQQATLQLDASSLFIMHYPINRVFYVSHDSQDLKIFSFIARGEDGVFRCSVFKALKKSQAMHVVRTIGQAFEVCHKINVDRDKQNNVTRTEDVKTELEQDEKSPDETDIDDVPESDVDSPMIHAETMELQRPVSTLVTDLDTIKEMNDLPPPLLLPPMDGVANKTMPHLINGDIGSTKHGPFTLQQLQQLYHQQLLQQMNETETSKHEISRLRNQLKTESDARTTAQHQVHRLLAQNRELIAFVQKLMSQLTDKYNKENVEQFNETWILSQLSPDATLLSGTNLFTNPTSGLGSLNLDFDSKIFDNSNTASTPGRQPLQKQNLTFDDLVARNLNHVSASTGVKTNHSVDLDSAGGNPVKTVVVTTTTATTKKTNPFTPPHNGSNSFSFEESSRSHESSID